MISVTTVPATAKRENNMNIHNGLTLNIYQSPGQSDAVMMPDDSVWTIRQDMNPYGWTLYDSEMNRHPTIQRIPGMIEFCGMINQEADEIRERLRDLIRRSQPFMADKKNFVEVLAEAKAGLKP